MGRPPSAAALVAFLQVSAERIPRPQAFQFAPFTSLYRLR